MGEIVLSERWDLPIKYVEGQQDEEYVGYFAGREREVKLLVNELARKREGSILITGHPGVGKSSLVKYALNELSETNIIPIFMSGPDMREDQNFDAGTIIRHLARRLYTGTRNIELNGVDNEIERFYFKTITESRDVFSEEYEDVDITESFEERSLRLSLPNIKSVFRYGLPLLLGGGSAFLPASILPAFLPIQLFAVIVTIMTFAVTEAAYRLRSERTSRNEIRKKAESVYEKDNTLGNLKYDLRNKIHAELNEHKLVYVIDELDKIDAPKTLKALEFFKEFFASSNAIFIFIAGEDFEPEEIDQSGGQQSYRPKSYTYFDSHYFITRPSRDELMEYFDSIVVDSGLSNGEFRVLKEALCFEAQNDFFDLKQRIKDRIDDFDGNKPIIRRKTGDTPKSNLYSAITVYEERYSSPVSKWKENEEIARKLFEIASRVHEGHSGLEISDPDGPTVLERLERDFHKLLHRYGALKILSTDNQKIRGQTVEIARYEILKNHIDERVKTMTDPTEFESEFVTKFEEFCHYHVPLLNLKRRSRGRDEISLEEFWSNSLNYLDTAEVPGLNPVEVYNNNKNLYNRIDRGEVKGLDRNEVENHIDEIDRQTQNLMNNLVDAFARAYVNVSREKDVELVRFNELSINVSNDIRQLFQEGNPLVIHNNPNQFKPKRVVIFSDRDEVLVDSRKSVTGDSSVYRIVTDSETIGDHDDVEYLISESPEDFIESTQTVTKKLDEFFYSALEKEVIQILENGSVKMGKSRIDTSDKELLQFAFEHEKAKKDSRITMVNWLGRKVRKFE